MKIIALDTSGPVAGVCIAEDGRLIGGFRLQFKTTHSENLMPMLDLMKELTSLDMGSVDAVAVASGPGSFTGLRIGAATAKGLADALSVPIIPVPTIDGIAFQLYGAGGLVCPMLDARRSQVYTGVYRFNEKKTDDASLEIAYDMEIIKKSCAVPVDEIASFLNENASKNDIVHLTGDGVPVYIDRLRELLKVPFAVTPFHRDRQSAEAVAALAFRYHEEGKSVPSVSFVPEYIRPSQAERVRAQKGK